MKGLRDTDIALIFFTIGFVIAFVSLTLIYRGQTVHKDVLVDSGHAYYHVEDGRREFRLKDLEWMEYTGSALDWKGKS